MMVVVMMNMYMISEPRQPTRVLVLYTSQSLDETGDVLQVTQFVIRVSGSRKYDGCELGLVPAAAAVVPGL